MIRHIVFFSARSEIDAEAIRDGLAILTRIPHALRLEVSFNRKSDALSKEIDVVVYGEFASPKALAAYKAHEIYAESVRLVRPLREIRLAADYDVSEAVTSQA